MSHPYDGRVLGTDLLILLPVAFLTSVISVVTGATSLITVPVMLALGMAAPEAIASNMVALTALSLGASSQFWKSGELQLHSLSGLTALTVGGSLLGALLVTVLPTSSLKGVVVAAMLVMAWVVLRPSPTPPPSHKNPWWGWALTFLLGIYGGLFSGGYVTLLTVVFTHTLGFTLKEAVVGTKWLNVFSSLIAVIVFALQGLVVWPVALAMALVMFWGAQLGAIWTRNLPERVVRMVFTFAVLVLAVRAVVVDVPWPRG
ncbi:sulfite exporter TauE/SafE family protein [Deinococcus cellulosilyticus]|uniref:Probable membrane transporter protein n=1 Tax=Deinococcus cellulosilyticus (strain DSM 18568 / NBRC 106333 / KACC 11606 / 5516J-15) TaxID=1223518 RepID=A0A511N1D7_DEIC1|nr:sulfite exporter TauE/SafE family protein [Deinococcus cellulosilyticus]GEM46682.1 UPF0721 transmembrane protein [Deinococcus cellulosilyticus NBRC 106333 = KACC 11606]